MKQGEMIDALNFLQANAALGCGAPKREHVNEALTQAIDQLRWRSVENELPDVEDAMIVVCMNAVSEFGHPYTAKQAMDIAFYSSGKWWYEAWPESVKEDNIIDDVTHWMPLPKPPEGV